MMCRWPPSYLSVLVNDISCLPCLVSNGVFVYHSCCASGTASTLIRLYRAVAQECGSTIAYKANVTRILTEGEGADVAAIGVELANGTQVRSKCVVSNATRWDTFGRLVSFIPDNEAKFRKRYTKSPSFITLHLGVKADVLPVGSRVAVVALCRPPARAVFGKLELNRGRCCCEVLALLFAAS